MRNVSHQNCRENQNARFMFNNFFPKIVPFLRQCGKIWWSRRGHKWQYNSAHALGLLDNQGYRHTHSKYVTLRALPRQQWLRERASFLFLYMLCLCLSFLFASVFVIPFCSVTTSCALVIHQQPIFLHPQLPITGPSLSRCFQPAISAPLRVVPISLLEDKRDWRQSRLLFVVIHEGG